MLKKFSSVLLLQSISLLCGLGKTIILGRQLSEYDFGLYSLLLALIGFTYPISLLGQRNSIVRFCSNFEISTYNFKRYYQHLSLISTLIIALFVFSASLIYQFDLHIIVFLFIATLASAFLEFVPSFLRTQGRIVHSFFLFRGINILTFILSIYFIFQPQITINLVLLFYGSAFFGLGILVYLYGYTKFPAGGNTVPKSIWTNGYLLLGSDLALLMMVSIDKFIIPELISFEALALYFAIISIFKIFDIILQAANFVLLPYIKKLDKNHLFTIALIALTVGIVIYFSYYFLGPWLVHVAFKGKYDAGVSLIPILGLARVFQFFYILPESFITIRSGHLKNLFKLNVMTIIISVVLTAALTAKFGLTGAASSLLIVWIIRFLGASGLIIARKN